MYGSKAISIFLLFAAALPAILSSPSCTTNRGARKKAPRARSESTAGSAAGSETGASGTRPGTKDDSAAAAGRAGGAREVAAAGEPAFTTVFANGGEGYPVYRIPSLVTSKKGVLLAFAEGRQSLSDHAQNDIVLKRSADRGKTWGPLIVVHEDGANVLVNPCAAALDSGRVLLMFQRFPAGYHSRAMGRKIKRLTPGLRGATVSKTLVTFSDDDGLHWSEPRDVTAGTKRPPPITATATGPGRGIVLRRGKHRGRIVMPTNESWWEGKKWFFDVYACYSDDGGRTWRYGEAAPDGGKGFGNEVQTAELAGGRVLLNSRSAWGNKCRKSAVSSDGGETWSPLRDEEELPEPQCMGTILRYSFPEEGQSRLIFANPGTKEGRRLGTVRLSFDEGKTWPVSRTIYEGGFAYSCLTRLDDGSIGLLFEKDGYKEIAFARSVSSGWRGETNAGPQRGNVGPEKNPVAPVTGDTRAGR